MKMTAEEILEAYNRDISHANMQRIADENGCTIKEIGEFLKAAAAEPQKKKPGRPKGRKNTQTDATKKDVSKQTCNKVEPLPDELRAKKYLIPPVIESISLEKIDEYRRLAKIHLDEAKRLELEANELQDFLNGGIVTNGD